PEALGALAATPAEAADRFSAAHLMSAAARVIRDVATLQTRARGQGKRLATLTLEADVRFASAETRAAFAEELTDVLAALVSKYHDERTPGGRRFRVVAGVHPAPGREG